MISVIKPIETVTNFIFNVPGQNLSEDNIVFTVKRIVHNFLCEKEFLVEKKEKKVGRPIDYKIDELLSLVVYGNLYNKTTLDDLVNWISNNDESVNYVLNNKSPSRATIGRFLKNNKFLIEELFSYIVDLGVELDLIDSENISVDGTFFKANASTSKLIRIEELIYLENLINNFYNIESNENLLFKIQKYYIGNILDETNEKIIVKIKNTLKKEGIKILISALMGPSGKSSALNVINILKSNYDGEHTISVTDPECRWMRDKDDKTGLNYNYQVAIDSKNDFIVAQKLVNLPTDHYQLIPMIETVKMNLGKHPDYYTADTGYLTDESAEYLYKHNIKAIIPDKDSSIKIKNKNKIKKFSKANFKYNTVNDIYICPNNQILEYQNNRKINKKLNRVYSTKKCKNCKDLTKCTKRNKREIFNIAHPLRRKMQEDYNSDLGRQIYKKRFHTGESYFGTLKNARKFPGIKRKGTKNAQTELTLQSIAHNIKIIHKEYKQK